MSESYNITPPFKLSIIALFLLALAGRSDAQIKIGTNGAIIAPSSILELESTNQGLLLPRLTDTVAINALNPPNGMLIYLTKVPSVGLYVRKVTGWEYLTGSQGGNGNFNSLTVSGSVTAGSFSGPLTGNATSSTTSVTATNSINSAIINDLATAAITYPTFVLTTPGNSPLRTSNTKLFFVPSTGILTATGFNGPLVGNVTGTATLAIDATNAANTAITNDVTTNAIHYPTFVSNTIGNLPQKTSSSNLTFNPNTGILTATGFSGPLSGNATSSTNATTTNITNDNATAVTTYPVFVTGTTGNLDHRTASLKLNFVPSTGILTANGFTSTVATGIAPFIVSSTTPVANLSATNSTNINITNDNTTITPVYPTFVTNTAAGYYGARVSSLGLNFVPSTGVFTSTSFSGAGTGLTGSAAALNAGTATALQTARTINGVAFDGTSNITVTAAAGTLTGNTLAANVLVSSLTQVGTVVNGTWNAGNVSTPQLRGKSATTPPTVVAGAGAGTLPTITITGSDLAGQITITIGTTPTAGSTLATVTYVNGTFPTGSYPVLYPANAAAAQVSQINQVFATGNTTSFTISAGSGTLTPTTTYSWNYHVIGN